MKTVVVTLLFIWLFFLVSCSFSLDPERVDVFFDVVVVEVFVAFDHVWLLVVFVWFVEEV